MAALLNSHNAIPNIVVQKQNIKRKKKPFISLVHSNRKTA